MVSQLKMDGKNILIGVSGSIAAYKACELVRLFINAGANVRIVMTEAAKRFVTPLTFEALSGNAVLEEKNESWCSDLNHIGIGEWADIFIIAPASANTINKLANGIADNLLLQTALAFDKTILLCPAANTKMIENPTTVANIKRLKLHRLEVVEPQVGKLACNTVGNGAMADPKVIFATSSKYLFADDFWTNRRVVVTGGGTIEKIDDVRYLTNFSSGKMAESLVTALYAKGADVCYITTREPQDIPPVHVIKVESTDEMLQYTIDALRIAKKGILSKPSFHNDISQPQLIQKTPWLFMAAAVSDYRPAFPQQGKLKKSILDDKWILEMVKNPDILKTINKDGIKTVAFKAEMDKANALKNATTLLEEKGVDAVALNILENSKSFGTDTNSVTLIRKDKENIDIPRNDKLNIAFSILENLKEQ
ncbi:bifunctional phosphopantothenoylcysteine decarboxylase/phosphopantothenate--cysteine ligase CoaBC [Hydrogenimonas thermophila]|uniref:Coenzyme A biosynthesis bifunctional protein CoaBC n=1 Tax=Hydrogenimonas thermophila TaxID=223786 RepID=A0A1I5SNB1_9BACT|nr:bifunctional phosphopantothenoylcysteine decarboxylase/phosphopantothenate--cysteine ligase CoaBC [Hydrogenimonas thermophila]SFP71796.1 phosphopantothenoylcysteine decarboxylase / phosphopantothenate--cysteine ligase [Hydrogenimonas thermophila]